MARMVRVPLTQEQVEAGRRLGSELRCARGDLTISDVAASATVSPETLRKIETGRLPTPSFASIASVARVLGLSLDDLAALYFDAVECCGTDTYGSSAHGASGARQSRVVDDIPVTAPA